MQYRNARSWPRRADDKAMETISRLRTPWSPSLRVLWLVSPIYYEFRIRPKDIYGTVTEIKTAVSSFSERYGEVLMLLDGLEDDLRSLKRDQHPSRQTYRLSLPD
jgi:hypothetical protein